MIYKLQEVGNVSQSSLVLHDIILCSLIVSNQERKRQFIFFAFVFFRMYCKLDITTIQHKQVDYWENV